MKLGLINSAWVQAGRGTAFGIHMTKKIGFDSIDVFARSFSWSTSQSSTATPTIGQSSSPRLSSL